MRYTEDTVTIATSEEKLQATSNTLVEESKKISSGRVRSGQVRSGQVRSGQVRSGQVRSGHIYSPVAAGALGCLIPVRSVLRHPYADLYRFIHPSLHIFYPVPLWSTSSSSYLYPTMHHHMSQCSWPSVMCPNHCSFLLDIRGKKDSSNCCLIRRRGGNYRRKREIRPHNKPYEDRMHCNQ